MPVYHLPENAIDFPDPNFAEPDGLLAIGGNLNPKQLLFAYQNGIFPWFEENGLFFWFAPSKRFVIFPCNFNVSKSFKHFIKKNKYRVSRNEAFQQVVDNCRKVRRKHETDTWISANFKAAYTKMHELGYAESVEVWDEKKLVGGLYGIKIKQAFFGESMFHTVSNASKLALYFLCQQEDIELVDCQLETKHLRSLGANFISLQEYLQLLRNFNIGTTYK